MSDRQLGKGGGRAKGVGAAAGHWPGLLWQPIQPTSLPPQDRFEYEQFLRRARYLFYIKGSFNLLMILLFALVLAPGRRSGPILMALVDGLLLILFVLLVRRWPVLAMQGMLVMAALSISFSDIAAGYQTGTSGVLYALLIVAGAVVMMDPPCIVVITLSTIWVYLLTFLLEISGFIPVQVTLSLPALLRVMGMHTMSFISLGVLSNTLISLYRQLLQARLRQGFLSALLQGFQGISSDIPLHRLLQQIVERAVSTIPAVERALILMQRGDSFMIRGAAGYGDSPLLGLQVPSDIVVPLLEKPVTLLTDVPERLRQYPEVQAIRTLRQKPPSRISALFPLKGQPAFRGLLVVSNSQSPHAFDANTRHFAELFALQASVAIENAQLYQETQARLQEARVLYRIGHEIAGLLQMQELVPAIYEHIQQVLEAPSFLLALREPFGEGIRLLSPVDSGAISPDKTVSEQGVLGWVMRNGETLRLGDAERELAGRDDIQWRCSKGVIPRSVLATPLFSGQQVIGALSVQSPKAHVYDEAAERFLTSLANYVAVAVQNAGLYDEVQQQAGQLQRKGKELQELVATVSQRLQHPVEIISGFSQLLRQGAADRLRPEEDDYLDRLQRNIRWVASLIEDMAFLAQLDQIKQEPEEMPLTTLVQGVCTNLSLAEQGIEVQIQPAMPSIYTDPVLLWTCLRNLFLNLQRLLQGVVPSRLEVGGDELAPGYRLYVRGQGIALSEECREHLFDLFFPIEGQAGERSGMGLAIAQQVCQQLQGRIWFESEPGSGTTFYMLLPRTLRAHPQEKPV
ncbi:MAG: GAF domain-containing protein [Chloroflexia bacterium]|nr:GAF domain-containing protein [Chloroflexia bacterium]